jgi:mannan endo-1,4-beta-mannosidase
MNYQTYISSLTKSVVYKFSAVLVLSLLCISCSKKMELISTNGTQFLKGKKPYYFVGANYWYGAILGSEKLGDRERLIKELDLMQSMGIDNLRVLVGAEGEPGNSKVSPALQPEQGVYNDELLDGLDFLLAEMRKRNMYAVLYMNNNWIWSGGMSQYLYWNGYGEVPNPFLEQYSWEEYMAYTVQFYSCEPCKQAYYEHVEFIMSRKNVYTGIPYVKDNTIMSWQVANEPRVMVSEENEEAFAGWLNETVRIIQSLDSIHLISTGTEGKHGFFQNMDMFKRLHSNKDIDYLTMHMWPKNWGWYNPQNEEETTDLSIQRAFDYMDEHITVANALNKPIVMDEFGFPRDSSRIKSTSSDKNRIKFYDAVLTKVAESASNNAALAGLNFWGFGGYASKISKDGIWKPGDDFTADPPQEPQGLNTIFASDEDLLEMIKASNLNINQNNEK